MEKTEADGQALKADGDREQPRSLPYSLETPYGFHLDLDFLKYVDDIEKGNTIRRVHIHRRAKQPKFSTLPRNFSLPESGSRSCPAAAPSKSWSSSCSFPQRKASLGEEPQRALLPSEEPSYRRKALLAETRRQAGLRDAELGWNRDKELGWQRDAELSRTRDAELGRNRDGELGWTRDAELNRSRDAELGWQRDAELGRTRDAELNRTRDTELNQTRDMELGRPRDAELNQTRDAELNQTRDAELNQSRDAELGWPRDALRARPQLLRASSMPEALPPGQSPPGAASPLRTPPQQCRDQGGSESGAVTPPRELGSEQGGSPGYPCGAVPGPVPLQPPRPNQQLQAVMESGAEEGDAADGGSEVAGTEAAENGIPAGRALSAGEMDRDVLQEGEHRDVQAAGDEESGVPPAPDAGLAALKQQIAHLQEQLAEKEEELEQVRAVLQQQDHEMQEKEKSIKLLASCKAQLEEQLCWEKGREAGLRRGSLVQCLDAAVNTELSQLAGLRQAQDKGINVSIPFPSGSIAVHSAQGRERTEPGLAQGPAQGPAQGLAQGLTQGLAQGPAQGHPGEASTEPGVAAPCFTQLHIHEHPGDDNQNHQDSLSPNTAQSKAGFGEEEPREGAPGHQDPPAVDPIGQYVKKIQELLQEQWLCLEHGYPELASAIKQPASKLSSIQNQLVNSLNSLLSAYSSQGPVDKENSNTHYQQLENSPTTSLKSIMKKKGYGFHAGGNGTKKNLQFVGVNGGYETTSSEDTSCEDSASDTDTETEGRAGDVEPEQAGGESREPSSGEKSEEDDGGGQQESAGAAPCSQQAHRCKPSEDFLAACQLLSEHLPEIRSTSNKHLHVLGSISQEWFQVSSHKSSSPEVVAEYLEALGDIHPQLLEAVVNLPDRNGNTALHYSVSHSNFPVAKLLLDTGMCCLDLQNRAGYTAVMLTPLAVPESRQDMEVVMRLLKEGDVNLRAAQGGQTALMLGVSHDRDDMVRALLSCQADVNLQDEQGTTALMVACRQGNADIVRLLLAQPGCQVTLTDKGGNSALSLAHGDIAALLRAHVELSPSLSV
ncbi:KN motif and ankyrin repeat domain-containing protein 4 isoform X3 [Catharus ustulatus]|uniref:KN motif and ankyrin repeat domain-containing protein 4 isoform X3 n=1 Tax=Catharus ustulatus TaxID=91951 RepID=UPI00140A3811|nr:KN motif and ankyrin repeat domain-containing protein 4 isoform X3 [Catharus ustulatus]